MSTQTNEATSGRVSLANEGIESGSYKRKKLRLDEHAKWRKLHQKIVTLVTATLRDVGILALLVIFVAQLTVKRPAHRVIFVAKRVRKAEAGTTAW